MEQTHNKQESPFLSLKNQNYQKQVFANLLNKDMYGNAETDLTKFPYRQRLLDKFLLFCNFFKSLIGCPTTLPVTRRCEGGRTQRAARTRTVACGKSQSPLKR